MQVSIIIVSFNAKYYLHLCLESCLKAIKAIDAEIIVVDNNSIENVVSELSPLFPTVKFYELNENLGFAKANNYGVARAKGEYILILNPDTIIPEHLFSELISFYSSINNVGIVGPKLIDANGNFHPESKRNLPTPCNSFFKLFSKRNSFQKNYYDTNVGESEIAPVDILVGAFMFLKRSIYKDIGGFDPRYFMYGEDIDLSYTSKLRGFTNYYKGDLTVLHYKGESTKRDKRYFKIFFKAMDLFVTKYYKEKRFQLLLMKLGIQIKYLSSILRYNSNQTKIPAEINKNELYWLDRSLELVNVTEKHIVLSTLHFSFQEILEIIAQNNSSQKNFYIHSSLSEKIIGNNGFIL